MKVLGVGGVPLDRVFLIFWRWKFDIRVVTQNERVLIRRVTLTSSNNKFLFAPGLAKLVPVQVSVPKLEPDPELEPSWGFDMSIK